MNYISFGNHHSHYHRLQFNLHSINNQFIILCELIYSIQVKHRDKGNTLLIEI